MTALTKRQIDKAVAEAIDDLEHQCDLIATRPLPCEVEWVTAQTMIRLGVGCVVPVAAAVTPRQAAVAFLMGETWPV